VYRSRSAAFVTPDKGDRLGGRIERLRELFAQSGDACFWVLRHGVRIAM
jgi:hypothetical protein